MRKEVRPAALTRSAAIGIAATLMIYAAVGVVYEPAAVTRISDLEVGNKIQMTNASGPTITAATGNPNTSITAPLGSLRFRTDESGIYTNLNGATSWANPAYPGYKIVSIRDFGAKGDGVTDDTAAIQAAIDYAHNLGGLLNAVVYVPASPNPYMFSNLKLWAYTTLKGSRIAQSQLKRIVGSTGNAITEKTAAEGNPLGAQSIWIRDLGVHGNSTVGNGIDLGFGVVGHNLESWAGLDNVFVQNFTSGIGIHIRPNAISLHWIYALSNQDGIDISGSFSQFHTVYAEANSRYQLRARGTAHTFFGVHCEPGSSTSPSILVEGGSLSFAGVSIYFTVNQTDLIEIATGANKNQFHDVWLNPDGATFTDGIYSVDASNGRTGTTKYIQHYQMGENSNVANWYVNVQSNKADTLIADTRTFNTNEVCNGTATFNSTAKVFAGSSGVTPISSAPLIVEDDSSTGMTIIGPASPNYKAIFFGNPSSAADGGFLYDDGGNGFARGLEIRTGGNTNRMTITSGGNVGIGMGTTAAATLLHVRGSGGSSGITVEGGTVLTLEDTGANTLLSMINNTNRKKIAFGNGTANNDGAIDYDAIARGMRFITAGAVRGSFDSAGLFTVEQSTTLNNTGGGTTIKGLLSIGAHQRGTGTALGNGDLSSCGGGTPTAIGTDFAGRITEGTTATGCVLTFKSTWTSAPFCVCSSETNAAGTPVTVSCVATATTLTFTNASASGDVMIFHCIGQSGST